MLQKETIVPPALPVSDSDLDLLKVSNDELRKRTEKFCFDENEFIERVSKGERWQQLLQTHLYFDHVITQLLCEELVNPGAIGTTKLSFSQKLSLVNALGIIPKDLLPPIICINRMRNNIAHKLNFEILDSHICDLKNCTPKYLRETMLKQDGRLPGPVQLHELLIAILMMVDVIRQNANFDRLYERKARTRLRVAAANLESTLRKG